MSYRFFADAPLWLDGINLAFGEQHLDFTTGQKQLSIARLTLEALPEGHFSEPTMHLSRSEATELLDALWRVGIRPSSGEGNAGQLGATEKHLEDMRRLVFEKSSTGDSK